jgi:hypothetical protein
LKASAVLQYRPDNGQHVGFEYFLWARNDKVASEVKRQLKHYVKDWSLHLRGNETKLLRQLSASRSASSAMWRAVGPSWISALKNAVVEQDDHLIHLKALQSLSEEDRASLKSAIASTSDDMKRAASILRSLKEGKTPTEKQIGHFIGEDSARWMLARPATDADCRKVLAHGVKLHTQITANNKGDEFGHWPIMEKTLGQWGLADSDTIDRKEGPAFDPRPCKQHRVSKSTMNCLLTASRV